MSPENEAVDFSKEESVTPAEGAADQTGGEDSQEELFSGFQQEEPEAEESEAVTEEETAEEPPPSQEVKAEKSEEIPKEEPAASGEDEIKELTRFVVGMSGANVPSISPPLTDEQRDEMDDRDIKAYETQRRVELVEARDFMRTQTGHAHTLKTLIQHNSQVYGVAPEAIKKHMMARQIYSPEDAARSLAFESGMKAAESRGASEALKKVGKPVNAAKSFSSSGRPAKTVRFYNTDADAHAGGVAILDNLRRLKGGG